MGKQAQLGFGQDSSQGPFSRPWWPLYSYRQLPALMMFLVLTHLRTEKSLYFMNGNMTLFYYCLFWGTVRSLLHF